MINRASIRMLENKTDLVGGEIGVGDGKNAFNILSNLKIKKFYLIDPHNHLVGTKNANKVFRTRVTDCEKEAISRLIPFKNIIEWIHNISSEAVNFIMDGELDFIYIDGNHYYSRVKEDIELYYPKIKIGGLLCGHDYDQSGRPGDHGCNVKRAVDEFAKDNKFKLFTEHNYDDKVQIDWWIFKGDI